MTSVLPFASSSAHYPGSCYDMSSTLPPRIDSTTVTSSTSRLPPTQEGYSSGDSDKKKGGSTPGAKRRPSRAGTRSVSTLTAAQLERKRANDREAQRAIRQRTKDHIESLERRVAELTANQDLARVTDIMHRNEELVQENAVLRTRLSHAVTQLGYDPESAGIPQPQSGLLAAPAPGPAPSPVDRMTLPQHPPRPMSAAAARGHHAPVSQPDHSGWSQHPGYSPAQASSPMDPPNSAHTTSWSPHQPNHPAQHVPYYGVQYSQEQPPPPQQHLQPFGHPQPPTPQHPPSQQGTPLSHHPQAPPHPQQAHHHDYPSQSRSITVPQPNYPTPAYANHQQGGYMNSASPGHQQATGGAPPPPQLQHAGEGLSMMQQGHPPPSMYPMPPNTS